MSLVIKKFEPGGKTTQPRLYKRGNDDIDLDAYIRDAESEFGYWLANSRLKDKEKRQVREAYSLMIQGINDGTFTYRIGGGYDNSVGLSNSPKGFDAAGLAAGFLGNVLRNQSVYTAPEEKPDPSKIEWKGNSSVKSALVNYLYGSDNESLNDFIDLDPYDTNTKKRGNANRSAKFKDGLIYVRDNFDNLFTSFTDADKARALENINSALAAFDNGTVEDNEYLDLGRATGMSNLRDMFFSGEKYGTLQPTPGTPGTVAPGGSGSYNNEDEWRAAVHPRSTVTNFTNRRLTTSAVYKREGRIKLNSILMGMSKDNLLKLIQTGLKYSPNGQELNKGRSILRGFGQLTSFENNFIIRLALEVMRRKNYLHQFPNDQNSYYIPFVSSKLDSRGTGFVYTISPDGNHVLREMDRWEIPYYTNQWHNEFIGQVPSNKNGGAFRFRRIPKALAGQKFNTYMEAINYLPEDLADALRLRNVYDASNNSFSLLARTNNATDNINPQNGAYDPEAGGAQLEQLQYYKDWLNILKANPAVAEAWANRYKSLQNIYPDKYKNWYNLDGSFNFTGFLNELNSVWNDQVNGVGHDLYRGRVYQIDGEDGFYQNLLDGYSLVPGEPTLSDNGLAYIYKMLRDTPGAVQDPTEDAIAARRAVVASTRLPGAKTEEELFGGGSSDAHVDEEELPPVDVNPRNRSFGSIMSEFAPDLIGAGRLWASLHTNNRVYDTVLPSLKPVLKDTYERYSPVTGAFSTMLLKNRQGAEMLSLAYRPFTSDASLAAARMFEGQRQANQSQTEGFLADDQEVRRTAGEALGRVEDSMARRSDTRNFNRASINQTNREIAQLGATRLKSNWQSWDNFLSGTEQRLRTRFDDNRERANNFYDKVDLSQAEKLYNDYMEGANAALTAWTKDPANTGKDITEWPLYNVYKQRKEEARNRANSIIYSGMARRYGFSYNSPYTDESNNLFFSRGWNGRYING